jgi:hypothetical protein
MRPIHALGLSSVGLPVQASHTVNIILPEMDSQKNQKTSLDFCRFMIMLILMIL